MPLVFPRAGLTGARCTAHTYRTPRPPSCGAGALTIPFPAVIASEAVVGNSRLQTPHRRHPSALMRKLIVTIINARLSDARKSSPGRQTSRRGTENV
ncbi:MAG: hypothetical protein U1E35_04120 [Rhodospirillales bacterium]